LAFSIASINREKPLQRYHSVVLPQGLKNSPTICQWYVVQALSPAQKKYPKVKIIHYMDDLLIAAPTQQELQEAHDCVIAEVQRAGLEISVSKIQEITPWKYLGWKISEPQKMEVSSKVSNLHDLQQLLGQINWMRPILGITNDDIPSLLDFLRGDSDIRSPRTLTPKAWKEVEKVTEVIQ
ncbi:POK18 protein, partial [Quiscalus mexicanus]|nr:POK18 protein [Quiscalus mexicanus]